MLSDVEAGETSQAGVLDQAGSLDLLFVKSGAAGQAGSSHRTITTAGQPTRSISPASGQEFRRFGPQCGLLRRLPSVHPTPQAILRQADFTAIPCSQRSLRLAVRTRPSQG